jgi:hypothetical protein
MYSTISALYHAHETKQFYTCLEELVMEKRCKDPTRTGHSARQYFTNKVGKDIQANDTKSVSTLHSDLVLYLP